MGSNPIPSASLEPDVMARDDYFRRKFAQAAEVLSRSPADGSLSVKFRNAFFCTCATCGWGPALEEVETEAQNLQRRGVPVRVEPHESGIEIIVFGTASSILGAGVLGLAKLILTRWNRPRDPQRYCDIDIEIRSLRTDGRFTEGRIARVRYPAQEADIEKALHILAALLEGDDDAGEPQAFPDE